MYPHHIGVLTKTSLDLTTIEAVAAHFGATIHIFQEVEHIQPGTIDVLFWYLPEHAFALYTEIEGRCPNIICIVESYRRTTRLGPSTQPVIPTYVAVFPFKDIEEICAMIMQGFPRW